MGAHQKPRVELLVLDLDNTVWDWFHAWSASFSALISELLRMTGLPRDVLESEIRSVHQRRGTSEYSWLVGEVPSLQPFVTSGDAFKFFDQAIHMQNSARKRETTLYPQVRETLDYVRARRVPIVAYTESLEFWTEWRIKRVDLDGAIDRLYSSPDHDLPTGKTVEEMRTLDPDSYGLKLTELRNVPRGVSKPDPVILRQIISEYGAIPEKTAYVGDSLMKDVAMAQAVGAIDVHAEYGESFHEEGYDQLQRVSHWHDADIEKEQSDEPGGLPVPSVVLRKGFEELLDLLDFGKS